MENEAQVFDVKGTSFAIGLFWQPLGSSAAAERKKEIRALSEELSYDLVVVRHGPTHCAGFAKSKYIKLGTFSAAAVVSKSLEIECQAKDFIFVSPLGDGRWMYVAQRDGVILPDGDLCFSSEDAARSQMMEHMSIGDWAHVFAPEHWGIGKATERTFDELVPRKKNGKIKSHKWWRLLPLQRGRAAVSMYYRQIFAACVCLIILGGALWYYKQWRADIEAREALEASIRNSQSSFVPPEHPWKSIPLAAEYLQACLDQLNQQNLFPGNWAISGVECSGGNLQVTWKPNAGGWIKHLSEILPNASIAQDGSSASVTAAIVKPRTGFDEALQKENARLVSMYSAAQSFGVKFKVSASVQAPVLPGQGPSVPANHREIIWQAENVAFPNAVLAALDGPGFRMRSMKATWNNGQFIWMMEGSQYVQP
ncbi:type 4b pilus protein PilO2 [Diaphorobacter sp. LR2014-1]|uniref:type 4b pilus protein PilO2 n=1 Tax=Diaphorobacter sp. LR2014-1 TaxID=1933219 RepID=UPI000CDAC6C2|nr:type 4b pilus protein PilO2 [Diaphorobacter sp. LR2014-1]POR10872.1 hypothetical protein BV908_09090 [Diaphorobacter sp. LR2014-1]